MNFTATELDRTCPKNPPRPQKTALNHDLSLHSASVERLYIFYIGLQAELRQNHPLRARRL
jgi:hypothetical protein